jgi:hypothetical protein
MGQPYVLGVVLEVFQVLDLLSRSFATGLDRVDNVCTLDIDPNVQGVM